MANSSAGPVTSVISRRFDAWTQSLLDLSKRNRLLYFKPQPNTTIKLVEPDLPQIWQRLVARGKVQSFFGLEAEATLFDDEEEEGDADTVLQRPLRTDELRTDPTGIRLGKTLLYLRQRGRTSLEEQGVVTLFATFGLLKWNEASKAGVTGEDIFSPLLLVPVSLHRESARKPYTLRLWEEEVVLNPALKFRLASEAKIELPEPGDADDLDLATYFAQVTKEIQKHPTWMLQEQSYLGLFSFHKIAMYRDLCDHRGHALSHTLVRALAGDPAAVPDVPNDLPQGAALDEISPHDAWQIVDADSSQQEAIAAARRGVSFVLQGPPGTGKSQTITNIIAECLAAGKKVLFVSEKMAALQVVHSRLTQSGLRDFCLEAHSHKSNKREVVQELDRTLRAGRPTLVPAGNDADQLGQLRGTLNDYARELHLRQSPSEVSIYEAVGHFTSVREALHLAFPFDKPLQVSPAQRNQISECLQEMVRLHRVLATHNSHPWRGVAVQESDLQTRDEIQFHFERLASTLRAVDIASRQVLSALNLTRYPSLHTIDRVLQLARELLMSPLPPREWLDGADLSALQHRAVEWQSQFSAYNSRHDTLVARRGPEFLLLPHDDLHQGLTARNDSVLRHVANPSQKSVQENALLLREELTGGLSSTISLLEELQQALQKLRTTLRVEMEPTLIQSISLTSLADLVARDPRPQSHWFVSEKITELEQVARAARVNEEAISAARQKLSLYDIDNLAALDLDSLIAQFSGPYIQAQKVIDTELEPDLKWLSSFRAGSTMGVPAPLTYHQAIADLKSGCEAWQPHQWMNAHSIELARFLKGFDRFETDWGQARENSIAAVQEASNHQAAFVAAREQLAPKYNFDALLALNHSDLKKIIEEDHKSFWRFLKPPFKNALRQVQATRRPETGTPASTVPSFAGILADLETARVAAEHRDWFKDKEHTHRAYGDLFRGIDTDWKAVIARIQKLVDESEAHTSTYQNACQKLRGYNLPTLLKENLPVHLDRFVKQYASPVGIIEGDMASDIARLQSLRTTPMDGLSALTSWLHDLQTARDLRQREAQREAARVTHAKEFGPHYQHAHTDWANVLASLQTCREIMECKDVRSPGPLYEVLIASGGPIANAKSQSAQIKTLLNRLKDSMQSLHSKFPMGNFPFSDLPVAHIALPELQNFLEQSSASLTDFFSAYDRASSGLTGASLKSILWDLNEGAAVVEERTALESIYGEARASLGHFFDGTRTDWDHINASLQWSRRIIEWFGTNDVPEATLDAATSADARDAVVPLVKALRESRVAVEPDWAFLHQTFPTLQIAGRPSDQLLLKEVVSWLEEQVTHLDALDEWVSWQRLQEAATALGLAGFWERAVGENLEAGQLKDVFWRRYWSLWLDRAVRSSAALSHFTGEVHESDIEHFRHLDEASLGIARSRLSAILAQKRPHQGVVSGGEVRTLQREALKKVRHKPLRTLFAEIPNVLQALKPCLLMSPLSVAQFLKPGHVQFDVVIFDEASQICSEDAVGAIMRGTQLIVVGDRKQLPPTRFFGGLAVDDEEDEDESGAVYESILDECATMGLPDKMLLWHYRSRNEELIAFSNRHFYESNLITFPGPNVSGAATRGVSFEKVDGIYIRGKGKDARTNPVEARRVAELAIEHFENSPGESLGVIAFNEAQMHAIQGEVLRLSATRPHLDALLNAEGPDSFFVKNLENVQGDERDVILFSVGYGPDQSGKFSMNFGPLNRAGGERRLNVAITRARLRVHIVASFEPEEIRDDRTSARGPRLLGQYLSFAKNGGIWRNAGAQQQSDSLEEAVARALEARAWSVERGVGFSDLRIDLAVHDPHAPERFLLGIEFDGPSYCSAQTARDRDRLRPLVLNGLGWRLFRLWSPDWIKNPDLQIERIEEALKQAQQPVPPKVRAAAINIATPPATPHYGTQQLANSQTQFLPGATPSPSGAQNPVAQNSAGTSHAGSHKNTIALPLQPGMNTTSAANQSAGVSTSSALPHGAMWHKECVLPVQGLPEDFYALAQYDREEIKNALIDVVDAEGPIRLTVAARRVVAAWGIYKIGSKITGIIENAAREAQDRGLLEQRGTFLWPTGMVYPPVRVPEGYAPARPIEDIAPEEIGQAALLCIRDCFALPREELLTQTARLLGFKQTGVNVRFHIEHALAILETSTLVQVVNDTWTAA